MCEKCKASQPAEIRKDMSGAVPRESVITFMENYRPVFASHPTELLMAGFLQLLSERIKQDLNYTPENEHLYMGSRFQIALGDMTGCRLIFEPLELIGNGQAVPREQAMRIAMEEQAAGKTTQ